MTMKIGTVYIRKIVFISVLLAFVLSLSGCASNYVVYRGEGILTVHYLDVGHSDCTFVEVDGEYTLMIDATDADHADEVCRYVRSLGYDGIDMLVLTHPHSDHIGGAADIIDELDVSCVYMTSYEGVGEEYTGLILGIEENPIETKVARRGVEFSLGGLLGSFLSPTGKRHDDENDLSAILKLSYGEENFLFMGDAGSPVESELLDDGADLAASVVKAGHHGAASASTSEFIESTGAGYVIFSCGLDNGYGHPSPYTVYRWEERGAKTFRTDLDSTVIAATDGRGLLCARLSDSEFWQSYSDIPSDTQASVKRPSTRCRYVLDTDAHVIHKPSCPYWKKLSSDEYERSTAELGALYDEGYRECDYCFN